MMNFSRTFPWRMLLLLIAMNTISSISLCEALLTPQHRRFHPSTAMFQACPGTFSRWGICLRAADKDFDSEQHDNLRLLSSSPPIWITKTPILSPEESEALRQEPPDEDNPSVALKELQSRLNSFINRSTSAPPVTPRLLVYEDIDTVENFDSVEDVVPYGLHVDTADDGGDESRRYISALVYLTDCPSAATTFPLAVSIDNTSSETEIGTQGDKEALDAAKYLLDSNVQHTQVTSSDEEESIAETLERAAWHLYHEDVKGEDQTRDVGLRILPRRGHCTLLSFILPDGTVDPRSWHSSEGLMSGDGKSILTFFFELEPANPDESVASLTQLEFGKRAQECIKPILSKSTENTGSNC